MEYKYGLAFVTCGSDLTTMVIFLRFYFAVKNGIGEIHWYLQRIENSQYTLVNSYYGQFVDGKRHGYGTFLYANGSKYEGDWKNNSKNGYVIK
jgi:hypothetical protein